MFCINLSCVVYIIILQYFCAISSQADVNQLPEIWLKDFREFNNENLGALVNSSEEFRAPAIAKNNFISKNGTDYVIKKGTRVRFVCQALYPVEWTIPSVTQLQDIGTMSILSESERDSEFAGETEEQPANKQFRSYLRILKSSDFFSVNFTCKATTTSGHSKQSSIHVYIPENAALANIGGTVNVDVALNAYKVVLPCRPDHPKTLIFLEHLAGTEWKPVSPEHYSFSPKIGFSFLVDSRAEGNSVPGIYRCSVKGSDPVTTANSVIINVTLSTEKVKLMQPRSALQGNAKVTVGNPIQCCSGTPDSPPTARAGTCRLGRLLCKAFQQMPSRDHPKLEKMKHRFVEESGDCLKITQTAAILPGLITCEGSNIDYVGEFVTTFTPAAGNITLRIENWANRRLNRSQETLHLTEYKDVGNNKLGVGEKVILAVGRLENITILSRGLILNLTGKFDDSHATNTLSSKSLPKSPTIVEYGRNFYYDGEPLHFACFGLNYFHAFGAHLRLNWKNGTKTLLSIPVTKFKRQMHFFGDAKFNKFEKVNSIIARFGKEVTANFEMESVDCFMPVIDSTAWDKLNYPVKVLPAVAPKIAGGEEEVITLPAGEKNMSAICCVLEGLPRPNIKILRGEKLVLFRNPTTFVSNVTDLKVSIKTSFQDSAKFPIYYKCIVENVKGKAVKTFKVVKGE